MKKFLFLGALAAMLLGTASCSNDMEPAMTDDGTVQFTIELPGNVDSRAIADGLTANKLTVAVYDADGNELPDIRVNKDIPHQTTVQFKLVKGQKYSFAFWAQAEGAPYTFDTANKTVNVSYEGAKSNDEKRDAFYAYRADLTVTGPMTETIYLYRPFAQLNYGASDLADAIKAGVNVTKSAVTVNHAATSFNLATGATDGDVEVTFTKEILPDAKTVDNVFTPAKLTVEETQYDWMAMNYFLVPNNEATIETSLQLYEGDAETAVRDITVPNVPVQKNHRTNILGNLFTEDVNFNIIIDENFDQPDYNINYPEVTDVVYMDGQEYETIEAAYNAAIAAGKTDIVMSLAKGTYTMDNNFAFENPSTITNVTVQAAEGVNPADIIINGRFAMSASSAQKVATGSSMTIKGLTLTKTTTANTKNDATHYYRSGAEKSSIYIFGGILLTVENCIFDIADTDGKATGVVTWGDQATTAIVKNCTFNCDGNSKPLQIGNGSSNTIDGCTFNQPKKYAVQVNHYGENSPVSQLIFKNNTINANLSKINYGLALDSRQEAYYYLNITVENNVMNNPYTGSVLYAHSNHAAWETVTVNNSRDEWGIYVP